MWFNRKGAKPNYPIMTDIEDHFADFETSKMMRELGFDGQSLGVYTTPCGGRERFYFEYPNEYEGDLRRPLWSQCEEFLWEKYGIEISFGRSKGAMQSHHFVIGYGDFNSNVTISEQSYSGPILARREGIHAAIKLKHKQLIMDKRQ